VNRYRNIAATWFALGVIAGVVIAIPSACQPDPEWHITTGAHQ
jgi:hypothetical protein